MCIEPKKPKRCEKCGRILRSWNKSGYCCGCISNELKKEIKLKENEKKMKINNYLIITKLKINKTERFK